MARILINEVKNNPVLWDTSSEMFKNPYVRKLAWKAIATRMNQPGK